MCNVYTTKTIETIERVVGSDTSTTMVVAGIDERVKVVGKVVVVVFVLVIMKV